jgi:hypothetical protein
MHQVHEGRQGHSRLVSAPRRDSRGHPAGWPSSFQEPFPFEPTEDSFDLNSIRLCTTCGSN